MKDQMSVRPDSEGLLFLMLREYREGKRSLGSFAKELGVPLAEAIDLLADLGVRSPLEYDDYLPSTSSGRAGRKGFSLFSRGAGEILESGVS